MGINRVNQASRNGGRRPQEALQVPPGLERSPGGEPPTLLPPYDALEEQLNQICRPLRQERRLPRLHQVWCLHLRGIPLHLVGFVRAGPPWPSWPRRSWQGSPLNKMRKLELSLVTWQRQ